MQIDKLNSCLYRYGETSPHDDYGASGNENFTGYFNSENKNWANDTADLAKKSIYSHMVELVLKIPNYFIFNSDFIDHWWAKGIFTIERLTGTLGDRFRNQIYAHRDEKGEYDDNLGAEKYAIEKFKDSSTYNLAVVNNQAQTKGKFLVAALGFINPELANDLEWAVVRSLDGWWWRNMGINLALGPGFGQNLFNKFFGSALNKDGNENAKNQVMWESIKNKLKDNFNNAKTYWSKFKSTHKDNKEERKENFLNFCKFTDKTVSSFLPVVNFLNMFGDLARPIARRLELTGLSRNLIRMLSIIDRPFVWSVNLFRFYFPEKCIQSSQNKDQKHKLFNFLSFSDLNLASTIGDIGDFALVLFEDKIKESTGSINHLVEIGRRIKDSAGDIYLSTRRRRAAIDLLKTQQETN